MRAIYAFAVVAFATVAAQPAQACSPVSGYHVPSNLELAERADTIVIGTVERFEDDGPPMNSNVVVKPTVLLKGKALPDAVRMRGYSQQRMNELARRALESDDPQRNVPTVTRSDPRELRQPNPDTLMGGCTRYLFEPGMKLLLFLDRDNGGELRFMSYPFARVSEDVPADDAPWVKAVRIYVGIAGLPKGERKKALIAKRDALRFVKDDPDSALIADDIDRELRGGRTPLSD